MLAEEHMARNLATNAKTFGGDVSATWKFLRNAKIMEPGKLEPPVQILTNCPSLIFQQASSQPKGVIYLISKYF